MELVVSVGSKQRRKEGKKKEGREAMAFSVGGGRARAYETGLVQDETRTTSSLMLNYCCSF